MEVQAGPADALGSEPIFHQGKLVGPTTSGAYGYRVQKSLALGFIKRELASLNTALAIIILGEECSAKVIRECLYDPKGERLKS